MTDSDSTSLAHAFVQRLIDLGLKHAVLSPGSRNAPLAITLAQAAAQGLITLHVRIDEREAAFFALGLSKTSDIPTLVCCTSGTAAVNFAPAVVEAFYSQVPLIVLTADRPEGAAVRGASQSIRQESLYAPHTVANLTIGTGADAQSAADRARIAWNATRGQQRGPAHINMHLAEPLLRPINEWPRLRGAEEFAVSVPATVSTTLPVRPNVGLTPVLIVGDVPTHEQGNRDLVVDAAIRNGWPVIMEPTAGRRDARASIRHHSHVADQFASKVSALVSVGRFGLGRHLRRLCQQVMTHIAFTSHGSGADPFGTATTVLDLQSVVQFVALMDEQGSLDSSWLHAWQSVDAEAHRRLAEVLDTHAEPLTGLHIASEVLAAASSQGSLVMAAASRSIRDVDTVLDFEAPRVLANLGVNGIDGVISTAAGVATAQNSHTFLLIGDLAFLHGSNGLLTPQDEPTPPLTVVVVDDDGGAIFSDLEQGATDYAPWFERVFGTPHGRDLVALACGYGVRAISVETQAELRAALASSTTGVIVVKAATREESRNLRAQLNR